MLSASRVSRERRRTGSRSLATFLVRRLLLHTVFRTLTVRLIAAGKRNESDIPIDAAGEQYSHVFGSTATAFERFVVDHKIMGPCWLNISKPKVNKGDAVRQALPSRRFIR